MNWDERGRLWVAETVDYPNELQPAGQGRDRIVICEDTDGDGEADKFTVFAEKLSIPTSLAFCRGGVDRPRRRRTRSSSRTPTATTRPTCARCSSPAGARGDTHAGPSNLRYGLDNWIYGMRRLHRLRRHGRRRAVTGSARASSASNSRRTMGDVSVEARVPPQHQQQHLGPRLQRGGPALRLDRQRQPERLPADPQPLLRDGPRLVVDACLPSIADEQPVLPDHRQGPAGRLARRLHRRRRPRALHGPHLSAGILEPHRLRHRADRPPGRRRSCFSRDGSGLHARQRAGTCSPATTNGPPRSWPRSAPTATSGCIDWYNYHRPAQPDARRASRPARATPTRPSCATRSTAASIASCRQGQEAESITLTNATPRAARRGAEERQHVLAAARPAAAWSSGNAVDVVPALIASLLNDRTVDAIGLNVGRDPRPVDACTAWDRCRTTSRSAR